VTAGLFHALNLHLPTSCVKIEPTQLWSVLGAGAWGCSGFGDPRSLHSWLTENAGKGYT
jgi:hypothetical protein